MTKEEIKRLPLEERLEWFVEYLASKKKFSMFSTAGNNRVKSLIKKCVKKVFGKAMRQDEYEAFVSKEVKKVADQDKFAEITDTAVREVVYWYLELAIELSSYDWHDDFEYSSR